MGQELYHGFVIDDSFSSLRKLTSLELRLPRFIGSIQVFLSFLLARRLHITGGTLSGNFLRILPI